MLEVISNTSCLIVLEKIDLLLVLQKLYGKVLVTPQVRSEFGRTIDEWIEVKEVLNTNYVRLLRSVIDEGEASTIALALETENPLLILDDLKARRIAQSLHLRFTGTLGVILKGKEKKLIDSVKVVLDRMRSRGFYLSDQDIASVLKLAKES